MDKKDILHRLQANKSKLKEFGIKKIGLFGSYLKAMDNEASDIDLLVEFEEGRKPGLLELSKMENELSNIFNGKKVDLRTTEDLSKYFRKEVAEEAEVLYSE